MQSCIADNINTNDRNNVSPIYFRQIASRFAYGAYLHVVDFYFIVAI